MSAVAGPTSLILPIAALCVGGPVLRAQGLDPAKAISQYNLDVWTSETSLPQNSVTAVAQTRDGYLWLGTYGGLVRFDGVHFTVFHQGRTEGLASNSIQALLEDGQGNLWIGTNGGLSRFKDGSFTSFDTDDGLANDIVRTLFEDSQGTLWIGTNDGLSRFREGRFVTYATRDGLTNGVIRAIGEEPAGVLWVGTNGGGLLRFSSGRFQALTVRDGLPSNFVFALRGDREGGLWIGTNGGGLCRKSGDQLVTYTTRDGLSSDIIWSLEEDRRGSLWVGTYGGGLCRLRDGHFTCFTSQQGLSNDFVRALLADREGSLWIGTYNGGLNRLRDGRVTTYTRKEGLAHDFARAVFEDSEGTLWIGTTGGGLSRFRDGKFRTYGPRDGVGSDVRALHETPDGALWIGSAGHGLARLERGRIRRYTTRDGLAHMNVSALASDRSGALWIGTNGGGVSRLQDGRWTTWTQNDGLAGDFIMAGHVDREGALWVGGDGSGLCRLKDGQFTVYTRRQGLASDIVFALHEDARGALWIGTSGGLSRLANGRLETLTTRNGLLDDVVFQILEDTEGHFWLSGNHGISRVARAELEAALADPSRTVSPAAYGTADGMKSRECSGVAQPAGIRTREGQLWFPTARGVVMIDPARNPRNTLPPSVKVEEVLADGQPVGATAAPGKERWEFRYTGLSFLAPQKVLFKYKLEGFDRDWVPAGTRRVAYYTRIPPGRYTFQVIACNNDGVWNDTGDRVRFVLRPYLHQTGWFYGVVGVAIALTGAGLVRMRVKGLEARKQELEALVEARTRALVQQQERTETALRETERQKEIAQEADRLKTEMLSIAAHDLKTPLQSIIGFAELTAALPGLPEKVSEFPDHCGRAARRMVDIIDRLLDAAVIEQGKLVLERKAVDLGRLTLAQAGIHQRMAEAKKQRIHVEVEDDCLVQGDESSLRQVIDNLLGNAIKFSPPKRSIRISVRREGARALLEVEDEGPGLNEADRERLFGRFQRLSARPTGGESSTGLGLSIVKQLVELQHGHIRAESEGPGKGSRFVVELPRLVGPAR